MPNPHYSCLNNNKYPKKKGHMPKDSFRKHTCDKTNKECLTWKGGGSTIAKGGCAWETRRGGGMAWAGASDSGSWGLWAWAYDEYAQP